MKMKAAVNLCTELNAVNCVPVQNAKWQCGTVLIYLSKIFMHEFKYSLCNFNYIVSFETMNYGNL